MITALTAPIGFSAGIADAQQNVLSPNDGADPVRSSPAFVRAEADALVWKVTSWEFKKGKGGAPEAAGQTGETAEQIFSSLLLGTSKSAEQTEWAALARESVGIFLLLSPYEDKPAAILRGLELGLFPFADVPALSLRALVTQSLWVGFQVGADGLGAISKPEAKGAPSDKDTEQSKHSWTAGLETGYAWALGQTVLEPRVALSYLHRSRQDVYRSTVGAVPVEIKQESTTQKITTKLGLGFCYYNCTEAGVSLASSVGLSIVSASGEWEEKVAASGENLSTVRDANGWSVQVSLFRLGAKF